MPFSYPPLSVLVTWPTPNYVDPHKRSSANYAFNSIFLIITTIAVVLRLYTRLYIRRWFGLDDVFICFAFVRIEYPVELQDVDKA